MSSGASLVLPMAFGTSSTRASATPAGGDQRGLPGPVRRGAGARLRHRGALLLRHRCSASARSPRCASAVRARDPPGRRLLRDAPRRRTGVAPERRHRAGAGRWSAPSMSVALRSTVMRSARGGDAVDQRRRWPAHALVIPAVVLPIVIVRPPRAEAARAPARTASPTPRAIANETLNAVHAVQAYAREGVESGRFASAIDARVGHRAPAHRRCARCSTASVIVLIFGAITLVLWAGRARGAGRRR